MDSNWSSTEPVPRQRSAWVPKSASSQHLDSILGQYYTSTAPKLGAVLMISTGIAPYLQLARYNAVRKIRPASTPTKKDIRIFRWENLRSVFVLAVFLYSFCPEVKFVFLLRADFLSVTFLLWCANIILRLSEARRLYI